MGFFRPQDGRSLAEFFSNMVKKWDALTPEEKASGDYINPDEPVVLSVPNSEWAGGDDISDEDDYDAWLVLERIRHLGLESRKAASGSIRDMVINQHINAPCTVQPTRADNYFTMNRLHRASAELAKRHGYFGN